MTTILESNADHLQRTIRLEKKVAESEYEKLEKEAPKIERRTFLSVGRTCQRRGQEQEARETRQRRVQ